MSMCDEVCLTEVMQCESQRPILGRDGVLALPLSEVRT